MVDYYYLRDIYHSEKVFVNFDFFFSTFKLSVLLGALQQILKLSIRESLWQVEVEGSDANSDNDILLSGARFSTFQVFCVCIFVCQGLQNLELCFSS